jgi:hypothetical protein
LAYDFAATLFEQAAQTGLDTPGKNSVAFDVGAGVRLVQNLGVGVTYSRYSNQRTGTLTTTIPNPLAGYVGGGPSTVSEQIPLQREENAVHLEAIYRIPIGRKIQVSAFGGPSYFRCIDDHITKFQLEGEFSPAIEWTVNYFDTWQMVDRGSSWGYHAGGSFTFMATKRLGVGTTVRYSDAAHTTINHFSDTTSLEDSGVWGGEKGAVSFEMKHGGIQWTGGVSLHF